MEHRKTRNDFHDNSSKNNILKKEYAENPAKQLIYKYKVNIGAEKDHYQWKVLLLNILQIKLILVAMKKYEFCSYISEDNEQYACDSHSNMFHLLR